MTNAHSPTVDSGAVAVGYGRSGLSADDLFLFNEGSHFQLYEKLGARIVCDGSTSGVHFSVWAPNARRVSVAGDFNGWDRTAHALQPLESSGIWEGFVPGLERGTVYKYCIESMHNGYQVEKTDPFSHYYVGTPQDFMYLVDHLHRNGIGVILDWVPSHFPGDEHGIGFFDGTHLYEHQDPRQGVHPDWKSLIYNYGRNEVRSFLISSACFWLEKFHADGLRVDAVASMLYLDYSRQPGEWVPNEFGGRENVQAIGFLRRLNEAVEERYPDVLMIAEESTAWPMVSRPAYVGGLGFDMKWDMGWMHDTLEYLSKDPVHRSYHHGKLNFRQLYAFNENFVLPLSHDEVVHGKGSLIGKMPGDDWQRFANLKLLFAYMIAQPGKKLLFMGGEFGQWREWNHDTSLDWHLLDFPPHAGLQRWVADLNRLYREEPALHLQDFSPDGFRWIDCNDHIHSALSLIRVGAAPGDEIIGAFNFTPVPRHNYRVGAPAAGFWEERLNSDARDYGGSCQGNQGGVEANPLPSHGFRYSLNLVLPPLGAVFLKAKRVSP